jgi:hypothetical protein
MRARMAAAELRLNALEAQPAAHSGIHLQSVPVAAGNADGAARCEVINGAAGG